MATVAAPSGVTLYFRTNRTATTGYANSGAIADATAATSSADTSGRTPDMPNVLVLIRPSGKYPIQIWNLIQQPISLK